MLPELKHKRFGRFDFYTRQNPKSSSCSILIAFPAFRNIKGMADRRNYINDQLLAMEAALFELLYNHELMEIFAATPSKYGIFDISGCVRTIKIYIFESSIELKSILQSREWELPYIYDITIVDSIEQLSRQPLLLIDPFITANLANTLLQTLEVTEKGFDHDVVIWQYIDRLSTFRFIENPGVYLAVARSLVNSKGASSGLKYYNPSATAQRIFSALCRHSALSTGGKFYYICTDSMVLTHLILYSLHNGRAEIFEHQDDFHEKHLTSKYPAIVLLPDDFDEERIHHATLRYARSSNLYHVPLFLLSKVPLKHTHDLPMYIQIDQNSISAAKITHDTYFFAIYAQITPIRNPDVLEAIRQYATVLYPINLDQVYWAFGDVHLLDDELLLTTPFFWYDRFTTFSEYADNVSTSITMKKDYFADETDASEPPASLADNPGPPQPQDLEYDLREKCNYLAKQYLRGRGWKTRCAMLICAYFYKFQRYDKRGRPQYNSAYWAIIGMINLPEPWPYNAKAKRMIIEQFIQPPRTEQRNSEPTSIESFNWLLDQLEKDVQID